MPIKRTPHDQYVQDQGETTELARQLGMSRKRSSQFLNDLERSGHIETRGHALIIKKPLPINY